MLLRTWGHMYLFLIWSIVDLQCCISFRCIAESVTHIHVSIIFIVFCCMGYYIEYSSLYYTVGPCWLSILYILVSVCPSQAPTSLSPHPFFSPLVTISLFSVSPSLCFVSKFLCVLFQIPCKWHHMVFLFLSGLLYLVW